MGPANRASGTVLRRMGYPRLNARWTGRVQKVNFWCLMSLGEGMLLGHPDRGRGLTDGPSPGRAKPLVGEA